MSWQQENRQDSADGKFSVEIQVDGKGHFRYVLSAWTGAAPEDEGALGDGIWTVEEISGLYGWRLPCRNDALRALRLRQTNE